MSSCDKPSFFKVTLDNKPKLLLQLFFPANKLTFLLEIKYFISGSNTQTYKLLRLLNWIDE
ncbi:hypothetical protein SDAV_002126 [Spiroplasma phoeniceum P40]|uniref:Uncharacterized protein n=1 Tax=Spiroplasma phoeniceum P40 TaxID=1276259 RepID=A0A345DS68_9MOLU|nr:hypothetical protein SDAV_002126 [Spiroplasma phoeniceum P40]